MVHNINREMAERMLAPMPDPCAVYSEEDWAKIRSFASDMLAGRWIWRRPRGNSIVISRNGYLLDGHYRMWAVILADRQCPGFRQLMVVETRPICMEDDISWQPLSSCLEDHLQKGAKLV